MENEYISRLKAIPIDKFESLQQEYVANKLYISKNVCTDIEKGNFARGFCAACEKAFGKEAMLNDNPYASFLTEEY